MKFRISTQQKQMTITSENEINLAANLEISFAAAKTTENGKDRERERDKLHWNRKRLKFARKYFLLLLVF